MKKIVSLIFIIIVSFNNNLFADKNKKIKRISEGDKDAKIIMITYESLTCGHCADFHKNVYPNLKKDFIDKGLLKIEFRHFPLDLLAFNASKIGQCKNDGKSEVLHSLFSGQKKWAKGKTPEEGSAYLKKFLNDEDIKVDFEECLNNKTIEDFVLNDRVEGAKKFKVNATPTIIINDKKFENALNYKNLKKYLEKLI